MSMRRKTVRFRRDWLRVHSVLGGIRIDAGSNGLGTTRAKQTVCIFVATPAQHRKVREFAKAILQMTEEQGWYKIPG
jgi:hypothetical protein